MCRDCGCGAPGESPTEFKSFPGKAHGHEHHHSHDRPHDHGHDHPHGHEHDHEHDHGHSHSHSHGAETHAHSHSHDHDLSDHTHEGQPRRTVEIRQAILEKNDRLAERNRGFFQAKGLLVLNVLSSPGSGKTTFLRETVKVLKPDLKAGVIVGDLATDNDAQRLRESGAPVVQITTGTVCHLEAEMVARALGQLDLQGLQLLIIENVGNLVCPASYDLGESLRVVLLSVTEGEDKPLKYPPMFQAADVVIVSKIDLSDAAGFDREALMANLRRVAPGARVFETSARTGAGMEEWARFLAGKHNAAKSQDPLAL
ncbi:MAG TPA: hydrogenase nickel incorporation protein HypB [Clostridia bacterium]|nr:hydrogenase nickel incorporation protein HypB [Clostridia bacterium]